MLLHLVFAALLLPLVFVQASIEPTITVLSTTLITITSCHPTVTDCPGRESSQSSSVDISPTTSHCPSSQCNADNCLRAFERGQGQKFCHFFTKSVVTDTVSLPSYATQCTGSTISRVSSACSCLNNACTLSSSVPAQSPAPHCNADNCLRAFERGQGQAFCSTFTQSLCTNTDDLPSYATQCTGSTIARVSSACSCLNTGSASVRPTSSSSQSQQPPLPSSVTHTVPGSSQTTVSSTTSQVISSTPVISSQGPPSTSVTESPSQSQQSVSSQVVTFTSVGTNSQGSLVTSSIVATNAPSSVIQSTTSAKPSVTSVFTNSQGSTVTSVLPAPVSTSQSGAAPSTKPPQVFSFTTTGTNAQRSTFSSVIVATFTPSSQPVVSQTASSAAPSQPAQSSPVIFSFTSTGTNAQGSTFSTVIVGIFTTSSSAAILVTPTLPPFSFTTTITDAQGSQFTTVVQGTLTPPALNPGQSAISFTWTEVGTDAQGNPETSVFPGFGFPFTSTSTGTDALGNPFTILVSGVAPAPGGVSGFPFPPVTTPAPGPSITFPIPTGSTGGLSCLFSNGPFPTCLYPPAPTIPPTCGPFFPECLSTAIPSDVQSELGFYCGTTPLIPCLFPNTACSCPFWPVCLSTCVSPGICDGYPFPDCLFTLYSPTVTATITTDPPNLVTISTSRSDWTSNTLYQTKDSNGGILWWPVFKHGGGCPECGAFDWILGNLPFSNGLDLFNIKFTLPGFPEIPEFHFPCVFFCHHKSPRYKPKPPQNDPDKNKDKPSSTEPSSSSTSSCQTATATDCSTLLQVSISGTATTTVTSVSCSTFSQCSATGSTTTSSTTTSASSEPTRYIISPKDNASQADLNAFTNRLETETDPSQLYISEVTAKNLILFWSQALTSDQVANYTSDPAVSGIYLDDQTIDEEEYPEIMITNQPVPQPEIDSANSTSGSLQKRLPPDGSLNQVRLDLAGPLLLNDLKMISQPWERLALPGSPVTNAAISLDLITTYAYLEEHAGAARIYIVDTGADASHPTYLGLEKTPDWIFAGSDRDRGGPFPYSYVDGTNPGDHSDGDWVGAHGTAMLSKAIGPWGVSRRADVTIVRIPCATNLPGQPAFQSCIFRSRTITDALGKVLNDVLAKGLQRKAIVSLSMNAPIDPSNPTGIPTPGTLQWPVFNVIRDLCNAGVVVVNSAGNNGSTVLPDGTPNPNPQPKMLTSYPAVWNGVLPLIVASAIAWDGNPIDMAQYQPNPNFPGSRVTAWAPGYEVECAGFNREFFYVNSTSSAAAITSGFVAYLLSVDKHLSQITFTHELGDPSNSDATWSATVRDYVSTLVSYPRVANGFPVIYNGEIPLYKGMPVCVPVPGHIGKRRTGDDSSFGNDTDSCASPDQISSMSIASVASVASVSLASVASLSSASVASVSSASVASVLSASIVSASSASVVSSSSAAARASRTSAEPQPNFTGYVGDICSPPGENPNLNLIDAQAAVQDLCQGTFIWPGLLQSAIGVPANANATERDVTYTVSAMSTNSSGQQVTVKTTLTVSAEDGAGACSVGGYPRSIGSAECNQGFQKLFDICSEGGLISWLLSDTQGCVDFQIEQSGDGLGPIPPPPSSSATSATSSAPPQATTGVIQINCNSLSDHPSFIPLTGDVDPAVATFCANTIDFQTSTGPSVNQVAHGTVIYLGINTYEGSSPAGLCTSGSPSSLTASDCASVFDSAATCQYGGTAILKNVQGCFQVSVNQVKEGKQ